ncbi:oligosaccharide flippase family protein [Candidatus Fermentibacteria bacterium]|nr:oligosaccharide flippase family protein [Candidatus Fermentibacteria bacterium]
MSAQSLTRTTFFTGASKGIEGLGSVLATLIVARYLGPAGYGVYAQVVSTVMLLWPLVDMGLDHVIVRELVAGARKEAVVGSALALRLGAGLLLSCGLTGWVLINRPEGELMAALALAITNILLIRQVSNLICRAFFLGIERVENDLVATAAAQVVRVGGLLMASRQDWGLLGVLSVPIAAELVQIALGMALARRYLSIRRLQVFTSTVRRLVDQSWPILLRLVLITAYFHVDNVILAKLLSPGDLGLFAAPFRLVAGVVSVVVPTAWALLPSIVRNTGNPASSRVMGRVGSLASGATGAVGAAFVLAAWPLVRLTFGADYDAGSAVACLRLLSMLPVLHTVAYIMELELLAAGRQQWALVAAAPALVAKVILDLGLAEALGPLTGAVSSVAADVLRVILLVGVTRSRWMVGASVPIVGLGVLVAASLLGGFR